MANAKIVAEITENGIKVQLSNWDGVSNVMIERVMYAVVKESQVHRARKLGAVHKANMEAEAKQRAADAAALEESQPPKNDFIKELQNVL